MTSDAPTGEQVSPVEDRDDVVNSEAAEECNVPEHATNNRLVSYQQLYKALLRLPMTVQEKRRHDHLSYRAASERTGIPFNTIKRFEDGDDSWLRRIAAFIKFVGDLDDAPEHDRPAAP